jgi:hypothetical protein
VTYLLARLSLPALGRHLPVIVQNMVGCRYSPHLIVRSILEDEESLRIFLQMAQMTVILLAQSLANRPQLIQAAG